ncbi:Uma2 family endonuclease [Streptomyces sp. NPDC002055]|uniref:Uma2 family endonuclease n=1 Tax=Streptomyces sp. NPDC002055 TaxID=3154534 RepID=UPI003326BBD2
MGGTTSDEPPRRSVPSHAPRRPRPPREGCTVDDLFGLAGLPPHTELIDGSLVFACPQREFHSLAVDLLEHGLRCTVPERFRVRRDMTVVIDRWQAPEPDVSVVRAEAATGLDLTAYQAADVVLAVEVVSPDSEKRDRERKPQLYAQAGIRHFWRLEKGEDGRPVVYVYELDGGTNAYGLAGIHHDRLKLTVPFDIDIDIDLAGIDTL